MEYFIILILILYIFGPKIADILAKKIKKTKGKETDTSPVITDYPYEKKMLLTKTEYAFYKILKAECDNRDYLICPKVRMEDFLEVTCKDEHLKYRGYIKSRHIDFIICDNKLHMLYGIELDDASHNSQKAQKTDDFKDKVFERIQIPLYRIKVGVGNYTEQLDNIFGKVEIEESTVQN
ncbi:MAG: DUF2726 domain-containing protein [Agathobacter sp.]|nr:DUF2726 domain-containing protein [Agathobacter sp.]